MTNGQGMEYATDGRRWCVSTISSAWGQQRWVKEDGGHCDCEKGTELGHSGHIEGIGRVAKKVDVQEELTCKDEAAWFSSG